MKFNRFEDIYAWQKARVLNVEVYKIFYDSRIFYFRDQILRATLSISNNIAEGFERRTNKEFRSFLFIAKGSCGELRSMLYTAYDFKIINQDDFIRIYSMSVEISKILSRLIKTLQTL